jgi:hypothetical protein
MHLSIGPAKNPRRTMLNFNRFTFSQIYIFSEFSLLYRNLCLLHAITETSEEHWLGSIHVQGLLVKYACLFM